MRLFWIILGIVALVWLGFLHFDRNEIRLDLDKTNHRIDDVEHRVDNAEPVPEDGDLNVGEEIRDEVNDAKEEVQEGVQNKEQRHLDQSKDELEEAKEEQAEKEAQFEEDETGVKDEEEQPQPKKDVETSLPLENYVKGDGEVVVAFNLGSSDVDHAFKLYDTPTFENDPSVAETYLNLDTMLFNLR